uniref:Uncharacterized protein n=1 Tax=Avena sativa TaxID=4498 RepID=A0ACD5XLJ7_AVESA
MAGMAQSAVDSLLVDEAQLLRSVHGDVRFIRDEMESMNSLLAHLTEAQHRAHHVRTWMKQVVGLARDSEAYVELFARHVGSGGDARAGAGLLGFLRRMVRHRVAKQIKELKTRVREVDERRLRYGVTVPSSSSNDAPSQQAGALTLFDDAAEQQLLWTPSYSWGRPDDICGRSMVELEEELLFDQGIDSIVGQHTKHREQWRHDELAVNVNQKDPDWTYIMQKMLLDRLLILQILYGGDNNEEKEKALASRIARAVYDHPSLQLPAASSFGCKVRMHVGNWPCMDPGDTMYYECEYIFLREVLAQVAPAQPIPQLFGEVENYRHEADKLSQQIMGLMRGRRFLILLEQVNGHRRRDYLIHRLLGPENRDCQLGFGSLVITTSSDRHSQSPYYTRILDPRNAIYKAMYDKARELINYSPTESESEADSLIKSTSKGPAHCTWGHVEAILGLCYPDAFAMKMLLHLLQANPRRTNDELHNIKDIISRCIRLNRSISKQMLIFCYSELPAKYRSCLMYMSIFPKDRVITRTSLARRWIAEGIINPTREYYSSTEEGRLDRPTTTVLEDVAMHHFEMLVSRGFIRPVELGATCNIKTCTVHPETFEFIARIAADVNFVDTDNLPQALAQHLSIHSRIPHQVSYHPIEATSPPVDAIVASLPYLARSSQWKLLKVLDLEGCRGLKKKHLKIICNILLLRYFSLRNTDVTELPKQIEMLTLLGDTGHTANCSQGIRHQVCHASNAKAYACWPE